MRMDEIIEDNKALIDYFEHKSGDKLIAPKNKEKYYIFDCDPDTICIRLSSYVGLSPGAVHCYAKLQYSPIYISSSPKGKGSVGGWLGGLDVETDLRIELTRKITRDDIANGRFQKHEVGRSTECFNSREEICDALKYFAKHLKKEYKFRIECKEYTLRGILRIIRNYEL